MEASDFLGKFDQITLCGAPSNQAISCAGQYFSKNGGENSSGNYTITIGNGSASNPFIVDLINDISLLYANNTNAWQPDQPALLIKAPGNAPDTRYETCCA